ncbi:MAG TPA: YMGG-like glycine zipper-containing protein [Pyrinomonadaceae bacterium]|nr:YMGG-like glycine zipper-containing protein [Pyrinomonadaceae bacterium]
MSKIRFTVAWALCFALLSVNMLAVSGQQRRPAPRRTTTGARQTTTAQRQATTAAQRRTTARTAATPADARLTGLYRLDFTRSDDPREAAERATTFLLPEEQQRVIESLTTRLTSPDQIAIERRGQNISIGSTRAPRVTFDADGRTRTEQAEDGHTVTTRAALYGDQLMISSTGNRDDEFSVNFDSIDNGTRLRVTRRIRDERLDQPVVVQSTYNKISGVARFNIYGEPEAARTTAAARNQPSERRTGPTEQPRGQQSQQQRPAPPVIRSREPERRPPAYEGFVIGNNTQFVATLNDDLSTSNSREGDRFTLTVREPSVFAGAIIEGTVSRMTRGGRVSGRSEMMLNFETIRLRDGRTADFAAVIESVRAVGGEDVRVDNEGGASVQEDDSRTSRTTERAAIGAAVGAIIGAISGGTKGAAIGAIIGAGAGAGSVYAQGRDDLELRRGTELILRASGTR